MDNEREAISKLIEVASRFGESLPAAPDLIKLEDDLKYRKVLVAIVLEKEMDPQELEPLVRAKIIRLKNTEEYYQHYQLYVTGRYECFHLFLMAKKRYRRVTNQLCLTFVEQGWPKISVNDFTREFVRLRGEEVTKKVSYLPKFPMNLAKNGHYLVMILGNEKGQKAINCRAHLYDPCYLAWVQGIYQTLELWLLEQADWKQFHALYDKRVESEFRPTSLRPSAADRTAEGNGGSAPEEPSDDLACG